MDEIWEMAEVAGTVFESFVIIYFISHVLGFRYGGYKKYIGQIVSLLVLILSILVMNSLFTYESIEGFVSISIFFIYSLFFLNGSIYKKILVSCFTILLIVLINTTILFLLSYFMAVDIEHLTVGRGNFRLMMLLSSKALFFFITKFILNVIDDGDFLFKRIEWFAILVIFFTSLLVGLFILEVMFSINLNVQNQIHSVIVIIGLIAINVTADYLFVKTSNKNKKEQAYQLMQLQLSEQVRHMEDVKRTYAEIQEIRHDMKHYIDCALTMVKKEQYGEAIRYLEQSTDKINKTKSIVFTASPSVNAILNSKLSICEGNGIKMNYTISGRLEKFEEVDISILLANLLDNAIEACGQVMDKPSIDLQISERQNYLSILIKNTIFGSVLQSNPELKTTKKDKKTHGYGLPSVKSIVGKYEGGIDQYEKGSVFFTDILLKFKTK